MAKGARPEEIIAKLREVEVRLTRREVEAGRCAPSRVTEQTYYIYGRPLRCKGDVGLAA